MYAYLNGFDYPTIHERAIEVISNTKRINPDAVQRYLAHFDTRCAGSKSSIDEAKRIIPGGIQHNLANNHPFPLNIVKAEGAYLYDVDGNRYIDFLNAGGPTILGNNYAPIRDAVIDLLNSGGQLTGLYHEYEYKLAQLIQQYFPAVEMFRMLGSGTEACMAAVRAARAYTGRPYIIKLMGGYHGWSDQLVYEIKVVGSKGQYATGIPDACYEYTQAVPVNDADALEELFIQNQSRGGTAAFILEAIGQDSGALPTTPEFHKRVRELCTKYDVVLIYDEVVTAFRLGMTGAQGYFGVEADMTVFGKIIAGGFPAAGGIGGRADIMNMLAAGSSHKHGAAEKVMVGGTLSANPLSCVAGYTAIKEMERTNAHEKLAKAGDDFTRKIQDLANKYGIPGLIFNQQSILHIDLNALQHITSCGYSGEAALQQRALANEIMLDYAMAMAAEGLIVAAGNKTYLNLQTIDVLDEALDIYDRVLSRMI